jgi:deoxyribonuclease V
VMNSQQLFDFRDPESAAHLQESLAKLVTIKPDDGSTPKLVCGLDAAYSDNTGVGVAAVVDIVLGRQVETTCSKLDGLVPYFAGLFGFREGPLLVEAVSKLRSSPDAIMVEGHGVAHPRRFGLACHIGIALNKPTVGVARKLLYGIQKKDLSIVDTDGTVLGKAVKPRLRKRPLYVSVGHKTNLKSAVNVIISSMIDSPEYPLPLRMAHQEAVRLRDRFFDH